MKHQILLLLSLLFLCPCGYATNSKWYAPVRAEFIHDNDPAFSFLIGTWSSMDPKVKFTESWQRSANGMLTCLRTYCSKESDEYDLVAFEATPTGARINMRRLNAKLEKLIPDTLTGGWRISTAHRGTLDFVDADEKFEMISKYDCPSPDLLNLEIETKTTTTKKLTVHMRRVK